MNKKIGDMNESELKDFIIELQEENSRYERRIEKLEDSWNKLKEYVEKAYNNGERIDTKEIKDKMRELESRFSRESRERINE